MAGKTVKTFESKFFKINEIGKKLGLANALSDNRILVTFNQLMKNSSKIEYILLFNTTDPEVPCLITYSNHFNIKILQLADTDVSEVLAVIKHARVLCVPHDCALCEFITKSITTVPTAEITIDLAKLNINTK